MHSRWYDPILVVGTERLLPAYVLRLLDALGVSVDPLFPHIDGTITRWEDREMRANLMKLLSNAMTLRTFHLRLAILCEQRRRAQQPWAMGSAYIADALLPVLGQMLNPTVLWCQSTPEEAAEMLLRIQPPTDTWTFADALDLCTRRHQSLARWLEGYRVLPLSRHAVLTGDMAMVDEVVTFCGLSPSADAWYRAAALATANDGDAYGQEKETDADDGHGTDDGYACAQQEGEEKAER